MSVILLIVGLLLFVGLVVVHEYGHFILARKNGVDVEEFGIGFPPMAWSKKLKSGLLFSINWLPLGGFVKLKGENDSDKRPGSFGSATRWAKTKIMLAGVGMNLLTAFLLLTALAWLGMPRLLDNQFVVSGDTKITNNKVLVGNIESGSPAQKSGLKTLDQIISISPINGQPSYINSSDNLPSITKKYAGKDIKVSIIRQGKKIDLLARLRTTQEVELSKKTSQIKGYLGIVPSEYTLYKATWSAPIMAAGLIKQFTTATLQGLGHALSSLFQGRTGEASAQVAGPVGIFVILKDSSLLGYQLIIAIIAIISLTLAIMNVLPIPALDGGRLFVMWAFYLARKPLTKKLEERIHGTGFALLMVLFVLITVVDVRRFL